MKGRKSDGAREQAASRGKEDMNTMNKQDLEACIGQYGRDIYTFCSYLARNLQETEDLYQDTFLKALELEDKLDFQQNPKSSTR